MAAKSKYRGHDIKWRDDAWVYVDDGAPTVGSERPCGHCRASYTEEGHDGCLGTLPGVMNACCGHGDVDEAYVQFSNDLVIRGADAADWINKCIDINL